MRIGFFCPEVIGKDGCNWIVLWLRSGAASVETQHLFEGGEYTRYLYVHGLSVETAEALAELHHKKMREELGIANEDSAEIRDLFHQKYRPVRTWRTRPSCLLCLNRKRRSGCV